MRRINRVNVSAFPQAVAELRGSYKYPNIKGKVKFYNFKEGTIVKVEVMGLPKENKNNFLGFHIHEGSKCVDGETPFESALEHLNLEKDSHPNHTGDLPSIYSNNGYAYMEFYTSRFTPEKIVGNTIIIHRNADDFKTNPSGNSGERIACGIIVK